MNLAAQPPVAGNGNRQTRHPELLGFVPGGLRRAGGKRACARRRSSIRLRSLGVKRNIGTPAGKSPRKVRAKQKSKDKQKNLEAPAGESTATRIPATQRGVADGHARDGGVAPSCGDAPSPSGRMQLQLQWKTVKMCRVDNKFHPSGMARAQLHLVAVRV